MSSKTSNLDDKIQEWLKWDRNEHTKMEIEKLVKSEKYDDLKGLLLKRLYFGTAGLRGKMSAGYSCLNDLVIIQTGQGLLKYLETTEKCLLQNNGIVVGYDGRHNSKRWADLTATIFVQNGYQVKLFGKVTPTPFVAFAVSKYKAAVGVMVTASHNPKEDNGYKVYCSLGTQIISPADKQIQACILENLEPQCSSWNTCVLNNNHLCTDPLQEVFCNYLKIINENILPMHKEINKKLNKAFTYTAMHGVGYYYINKVLDTVGIKIIPVNEQIEPDPEFPTVRFPNPEEGKSALDLSIKTANEHKSTIILANDPDADRFAAAEKNPCTGEWKVFTGNELGALFGWWTLYCFKIKNPNIQIDETYMISSTVSSMILKSMSKKEGFKFEETLTGFKWMGNKSVQLMNQGKTVLYAFEESIGYMCGTAVLDKDGVSAATIFATMASFLYNNKQTVAEKLEDIYNLYGQHLSLQSYYICHDPVVINNIFKRIRNYPPTNKYPSGVLNNKYKIIAVRDLTTGYDDNQPDKKAVLPVDSKSHMITFYFENGLVCTLRTSGTEPKIKYYTELCASPEIKDINQIKETLNEMVLAICMEFLEPEKNKLIPKSN